LPGSFNLGQTTALDDIFQHHDKIGLVSAFFWVGTPHVSKDIPYSFNNFFFHKCPAYDESCSRANLYRLTINSLSFGGMPIPLFDFL